MSVTVAPLAVATVPCLMTKSMQIIIVYQPGVGRYARQKEGREIDG